MTARASLVPRMTDEDLDALAHHERTIKRGLRSFVDVGTALAVIRDEQLYREQHTTFEAYCKERWGFGRAQAYRQINAAKITEAIRSVSPRGDTPVPTTEKQARQIADLDGETAAAVMADAHERTDGAPTATAVAESRARLAPRPPSQPEQPDDNPLPPYADDPIARAKADVMRQPWIAAGRTIERIDVVIKSLRAAGTGNEVLAETTRGNPSELALWLDSLDTLADLVDDWRATFRRRNLRSVKVKAHELINDALSDWREVRNAADLANDIVARLDDDERERLIMRGLTDEVRHALRRKDDSGVPTYSNVDQVAPDGKKRKIYKRTELFDVADYKVAIKSYQARARENERVAESLAADCATRLGVQRDIDGEAVAS